MTVTDMSLCACGVLLPLLISSSSLVVTAFVQQPQATANDCAASEAVSSTGLNSIKRGLPGIWGRPRILDGITHWDQFKSAAFGLVDKVSENSKKKERTIVIAPPLSVAEDAQENSSDPDAACPPSIAQRKLSDVLKASATSRIFSKKGASSSTSLASTPESFMEMDMRTPLSIAPAMRTSSNLASDLRSCDLRVRRAAQQRLRDTVRERRNHELQERLGQVLNTVSDSSAEEPELDVFGWIEAMPQEIERVFNELQSMPKQLIQTTIETKETVQTNIKTTKENIEAIPKQIVHKTVETKESIETRIRTTKENIEAIPRRVMETTTNAKESVETKIRTTKETVESGIQTTKQVAQDIADIPNKVTRSIENIQKKIADTKATINEAIFNVKVFVGLEKPKPKPKRSSPEPNTSEVVLSAIGSIAKGGATFAWWLGSSVAQFAWNCAQDAIKTHDDELLALPASGKGAFQLMPETEA